MSNHPATHSTRRLVYAAICFALCLVLPFLTGQIPQIGSALSPMHLPVLLAGFLCGPWWALAVGALAPLVRSLWLSMPPLFPTAAAMAFELAAYGLTVGLLYKRLPKTVGGIYGALIAAMLMGRIVWGAAMVVLTGLSGSAFTWGAFLAGAFVNAVPGIIVQLLLVPAIVVALQKAKILQ